MSRTLKTDIPGIDWRVSIEDAREQGIAKLFAGRVARPLPLVVEIGYGRGEFLIDLAQREPELDTGDHAVRRDRESPERRRHGDRDPAKDRLHREPERTAARRARDRELYAPLSLAPR